MLTPAVFASLALTCLSQLYHRALTLSKDEVRAALSHTSLDQMWQRDLRPLLVTRYPGSLGGQEVQEVSLFPHLKCVRCSHVVLTYSLLIIFFLAAIKFTHQHIKTTLGSLGAGWEVTLDSFRAMTPYGELPFTNIIATLNPSAKRRLVLACHHDSKYYPPQWHGKEFQGATDSAVPCAMILELVRALDEELKAQKVAAAKTSIWLFLLQ